MSREKARVDGYLDTIARLEPDLHGIDAPGGIASIAISLKRIADALDRLAPKHQLPPMPGPTHARVAPLTDAELDRMLARGEPS